LATQTGRVDEIKRLLKRWFKVNSKMNNEDNPNHKGTKALLHVAEGGHVEVRSAKSKRRAINT